MHVLVAGGTGVIGRRVVARLVGDGHTVSAIARTLNAAQPLYDTGARPVLTDLLDRQRTVQMARVRKPDAVINLAAPVPNVSKPSAADWAVLGQVLREGTATLAQAAAAVGVQVFVQLSVALVHDSSGSEWTTEQTPTRKHPLADLFLAAEEEARRSGAPTIVLRTGHLYAPDSVHTQQLLQRVRSGRPSLVGDGANYWSPLHADDAAAAFALALRREARTSQVLLIADDAPATQRGAVETLAAALETPKPRAASGLTGRVGLSKEWVDLASMSIRVRNTAAKTVLGWTPAYPSIREGAASLRGAAPAGTAAART